MSLSIRRAFGFSSVASLYLLVACSASDDVSVSLVLPTQKGVSIQAAASDGTTLVGSQTGLITNRVCYFVHVTAPDLIVPGTGDGDKSNNPSCAAPVSGLGKIFGPYSYGSDALIKISSGPNRVFDLIGFINPYPNDPTCSKPWRQQLSPEAGRSGTRVEFFYGDYVIDPDESTPAGTIAPTAPDGRLGIYARSAAVNLAPGKASVALNPVTWTDNLPTPYGCDGGGNNEHGAVFPEIQNGFISTSMQTVGFLDFRCPEGVSAISLELGAPPATAATCNAQGRAVFHGLDFSKSEVCPFDANYDGEVSVGETVPCLSFEAKTPSGNSVLAGAIIDKDLYPIVKNGTDPADPEWSFSATMGRFAGYKKTGVDRSLYVAVQSTGYQDVQQIDLRNQLVVHDTNISSFDWDGNNIANVLPATVIPFSDIIIGRVGGVFRLIGTALDGGLGALRVASDSTYPSRMLSSSLGDTTQALIASEFGSHVAVSKNMSEDGYNALLLDPSTGSISRSNNLRPGQVVKVTTGVADCNPSLVANEKLKVLFRSPGGFTLQRAISPFTTIKGCSALNIVSNTAQLVIDTSLGGPSLNGIDVNIPLWPGLVIIKKLHITDQGNMKTVVAVADTPEAGFSVTKCLLDGSECASTQSYWVPSTYPIFASDVSIDSTGVPILTGLTQDVAGFPVIERWRLPVGSDPTIIPGAPALHPAFSFSGFQATLRTMRLVDQDINQPNSAMLALSVAGQSSAIYRTRDGGANWYRVKELPSSEKTIDIIPVHNHHLSSEGNHWEPAFALLKEVGGVFKLLRQDWHGF